MRLDDEQESSNVENRRGGGGFRMPGGGGQRVGGGSLGFGGIILIIIFALIFRINPLDLLSGNVGVPGGDQAASDGTPGETRPEDAFVGKVLHSTETVWGKQFAAGKMSYFGSSDTAYTEPKLVLFADSISTACGGATSAVGPFYCPGDSKVYLDTSFFDLLKQKLNSPGDFAQAYVIAHEVGHHIQNLVGISAKADQARNSMSGKQYNAFSVKMELQADCFAGVWGHDAQDMGKLDPDDLDEALNAASQIGDDNLQKQGQGYVVPDSFTHGTAAQRSRWFKRGFESGDVSQCDTFTAASL